MVLLCAHLIMFEWVKHGDRLTNIVVTWGMSWVDDHHLQSAELIRSCFLKSRRAGVQDNE